MKNKNEAKNYYNLKKSWLKESNGDRKKYSDWNAPIFSAILKKNLPWAGFFVLSGMHPFFRTPIIQAFPTFRNAS
jgi:hypothetical protein